MHLNPNVREPVNRILAGHDRIHLIAPLTYEPFVWLMEQATVILTDSGRRSERVPLTWCTRSGNAGDDRETRRGGKPATQNCLALIAIPLSQS